MFWDRVAWAYDIFAEGINRKADRALCTAVERLIAPSDAVLECACGTGLLTEVIAPRCKSLVATDSVSSVIGRAGADFKREFTLDTYKQFFADAGYTDGDYALCAGRIPCAVAVLRRG